MSDAAPIRFPDVRPGEPMVVSGTLFQTYERCPEQAAGRLRGVYGPESRASFVGGLAHRVFARHLAAGPIGPDRLPSVCREEIGASMNPKLAALGLKPSQLEAVVGEVGALYERFKTLGADGFEGAEVPLEAEPADGLTLRGKVDAVFSDGPAGTRLVDWKTGGLGEPEAQLGFYALLWALERGEIPGRVEAVSVSSGERYEEVPTRTGVEEVAGRVAAMVDRLREAFERGGSLPRDAGPWCRWCPLLDECDEGRAARAILDA
ncbi:MAG: PD-(D/E)XK nuclease family protein [Actinobacteria bacterium]|nr:PD-(D/E)XK nuclease family protein [Actinomycetota bacterium]